MFIYKIISPYDSRLGSIDNSYEYLQQKQYAVGLKKVE